MSRPVPPKTPVVTVRLEPKQIAIVATLVLLLYVVVPQVGSFRQSFQRISHAELGWVLFGVVCYLATSLLSTGIYRLLSPRQLPLGRTAVVQYGSSFANRLLPAGLGALGVGYFYLRKQKCTPAAALAVVTLNNLLGTVGHLVLLGLIVLGLPMTFQSLHLGLKAGGQAGLVLLVAVLVGLALGLLYIKFRRRVRHLLLSTLSKLAAYRRQKTALAGALSLSMLLTLLHALCLWAAAQALHSSVSLAAAVVILGIGVSIGAAIPSPGGLGGAEAGLVAGLIAFGVSAATAVAIAIVYRLTTYWLGFVVGAVAFVWSEKKGYF